MICNVPPAYLWWKESLPYIIFLSLWANIYSSISADQAAEAKKEAQNAKKSEDQSES